MMAPPFPLDFWQVHAPALKTRNACEMTCLSSGYWAARSTTELVPHGTLSFPLHGIYGLSWRLLFRVPIPKPETGRSAATYHSLAKIPDSESDSADSHPADVGNQAYSCCSTVESACSVPFFYNPYTNIDRDCFGLLGHVVDEGYTCDGIIW